MNLLLGHYALLTGALRSTKQPTQYVSERMVIMTIALIVALFTLAVFITPKKTSVKPEVVARFQAMTPGLTMVNRDCGLYPAVEDEEIVDITDEVEIIPSDDEIAKESRGYKAIDDALRSFGERLGADREIQELEAQQRELRSRLIAARSNKRLAEIFLN